MNEAKVTNLTISELQTLIRQTVQEAVSEVMVEFMAAAEVDAQVAYEAEMVDFVRHSMESYGLPHPHHATTPKLDD